MFSNTLAYVKKRILQTKLAKAKNIITAHRYRASTVRTLNINDIKVF